LRLLSRTRAANCRITEIQRRERSAFLSQNLNKLSVPRNIVSGVAGETAPPFFSEFSLDNDNQLSSAGRTSVDKIFRPNR
jgi:hypothetical protein